MRSRRFIPPESCSTLASGLVGELHEVEELVRPLQNHLAGQIEVPAVDEQVLAYLQLVVEVVLLRDDPDAALYLPLVAVHVEAGDRELAARRYDGAVDHLHRRGLPGPVGAQKTETLPPETSKSTPLTASNPP